LWDAKEESMKLEIGFGKATILTACLVALGCSAGIPANTTSAPHYGLQALDDEQVMQGIVAQLPARIAVADAPRQLVTIAKEQVKVDYNLQATGTWNDRARTSSTQGDRMRTRGTDRDRDNDRDRGNFRNRDRARDFFHNDRLFNSSIVSYYPYRSYYFPYYLSGSYYYPYGANCTAPFLVRSSLYYYPGSLVNLNSTTGQTSPWCTSTLGVI
jgi:hypothetical protein